ncbi:MAG: ArsR family transcriptional regulator [Methanolobus sp.]
MSNEDQEQRRQEWYERVKKRASSTGIQKRNMMQNRRPCNPVRRNIIKSLNEKKMTFDELKAEFKLDNMPLKLHLGMLEDILFVEKEAEDTYVITPRGEDYLEAAETKTESPEDLKKRRDEWYEKVKKEASSRETQPRIIRQA